MTRALNLIPPLPAYPLISTFLHYWGKGEVGSWGYPIGMQKNGAGKDPEGLFSPAGGGSTPNQCRWSHQASHLDGVGHRVALLGFLCRRWDDPRYPHWAPQLCTGDFGVGGAHPAQSMPTA